MKAFKNLMSFKMMQIDEIYTFLARTHGAFCPMCSFLISKVTSYQKVSFKPCFPKALHIPPLELQQWLCIMHFTHPFLPPNLSFCRTGIVSYCLCLISDWNSAWCKRTQRVFVKGTCVWGDCPSSTLSSLKLRNLLGLCGRALF